MNVDEMIVHLIKRGWKISFDANRWTFQFHAISTHFVGELTAEGILDMIAQAAEVRAG